MTARAEAFDAMAGTDQARRVSAMIREGTVIERRADGMVRVETGDLTTDWLPTVFGRAGDDKVWWPLDQGEQVLVLSPSGDSRNGVVIGSTYSDSKAEPSENLDRMVITFRDGTVILYDRAESLLSVDAVGRVFIKAGGEVHLEAPSVFIKSPATTVDGNLSVGSGATGSFVTTTGQAVTVRDGIIVGIE